VSPELACAVLSYRDEPGLVAAVQSVVDQGEPVEIVVVNSGGGDPEGRLRAAGIKVPVLSFDYRLFPGAARNVGIDNTGAPYVSFLAADCVAEPGWVAGRLREHRRGAFAVAATLTNAEPAHLAAWASYLVLHNRVAVADRSQTRLLYGLSYDRRLFARYGRFLEHLRAGEDTEFNARFRDAHPIAKAADVRTAHRYPTTAGGLLRDAFRRGRLQATMRGQIASRPRPRSFLVAANALLNVPYAFRFAWRAPAEVRPRLLCACALVAPAGIAYALGALSTTVQAYRVTTPASRHAPSKTRPDSDLSAPLATE
jgi:glycosyltransferase involved in cell wall biosynthesis